MRKIFTSFFLVAIGLVSKAQTPNLKWANAIGENPSLRIAAIDIDAAGNHVIVGDFNATQDIDPGGGTATITPVGSAKDVFVAKYDPNGNFMWVRTYGGSNEDEATAIKVDADGNLIVAALIRDIVDLNPDAGVLTANGGSFGGSSLIKLDPTGNFLWGYSVELASGGASFPKSIALDNVGNIYFVGENSGNNDYEFGTGVTLFNNIVYMVKFSPSGNFNWVKGTNGIGYPNALEYHAATNALYLGCYAPFGPRVLDFSSSTTTTLPGTTGHHGCVIKMDTSAAYINHLVIENNQMEFEISDIEISDYLYVTGRYFGTADFDPSSGTSIITGGDAGLYERDGFVAKYDLSFNLEWAKHFDCTTDMNTNSVISDDTKNVYVSVFSNGSPIDMDPGSGTANFTWGVFVVKLDSLGNYQWTAMADNNRINQIKLVYDQLKNSIHGAGHGTYATIDFDPTAGVFDLNTYNTGFMFEWGYCTSIGDVDVAVLAGTLTCTEPGITSYQWVDCANSEIIAGANASTFTPTLSSLYSVIVSGAGCTTQSDCYTFSLGMKEDALTTFRLYPNPANTFIQLETSNQEELMNCTYTLFDISGKRILQGRLNGDNSIDVRNVPNGVYSLQLTNKENTSSLKLIKE